MIAVQIAIRVGAREREMALKLGATEMQAAWACHCAVAGVLDIAKAPDKPAVWPRGGEPR